MVQLNEIVVIGMEIIQQNAIFVFQCPKSKRQLNRRALKEHNYDLRRDCIQGDWRQLSQGFRGGGART